VFEDLNALRKVKADVLKSKTPLGECSPHGLTPPTFDIVHRRYEPTRVKGTYPPNKIRTVMNDIINYSSDLQKQQAQANQVLERIIEVEEVVDFQEWMIDPAQPEFGRTIVIEDGKWNSPDSELLMYYPEVLITMEDREEDEFDKMAQAQKVAEDETKVRNHGENAIDEHALNHGDAPMEGGLDGNDDDDDDDDTTDEVGEDEPQSIDEDKVGSINGDPQPAWWDDDYDET
jgi:hypothetical protein